MTGALVVAEGLEKVYRERGGLVSGGGREVHALNGVDLEILHGEILAVVGETGCGKSTLARCLAGLTEPTDGTVTIDGASVPSPSSRGRIQMVFQDPGRSLDPRLSVEQIIAEPLRGPARRHRDRIAGVLERVHLTREILGRRPHSLSGGQQQRVAIARAIVSSPSLVLLDEPTYALDWSIRADVLRLLLEIKQSDDVTYLLISHDLNIVEHIADRVAVMYLGRVVEFGRTSDVFDSPLHPYTQALLSAKLGVERDDHTTRIRLAGDPPSPASLPAGCHFAGRCPLVRDQCLLEYPAWASTSEAHGGACNRIPDGTHRVLEMSR